MARRFLTDALLFLLVVACLYAGAVALLNTIAYKGTPVVHAVVTAMNRKGGHSHQAFAQFDPGRRYDAVILGSSHAYRGYDPELFARRGHAIFNLGSTAQSPMNSYWILRDMLAPERTGLLLLDVYDVAMEVTGLESTADLVQNIPSDAAALHMAASMRDPRCLNMLALRWMNRHRPVMYVDSTYVPGGYSRTPDSLHADAVYPGAKPLLMDERQQRFLRCILEHCREHGFRTVLVNHPAPARADRAKHEAFISWLKREVAPYGFPILDFAFDHGLPLDDAHHFYDHNHLNQAGVALFNAMLIDRLEHDGLLPRR